MGTLRHTLIVRNPDTLEAVALVAGTELPAWASSLVSNDDVEGSAETKRPRARKSAEASK